MRSKLFKIPAMAEHVFVWEDCSAKQNLFCSRFFQALKVILIACHGMQNSEM